jgi:2-isopropylmalate synthase
LLNYKVLASGERQVCEARIMVGDNEIAIHGEGSGPIDAFIAALVETLNEPLNVVDYQEYALNEGSEAQAICIIAIADAQGARFYGVGLSQNTTTAAFGSIIAAINRKWR